MKALWLLVYLALLCSACSVKASMPSGTLPTGIKDNATIRLDCGKEYRGNLNLDSLKNIRIYTEGVCGKAVINAATVIAGWQSEGPNIWVAKISFAPKQVLANNTLLELAHTPRTSGNAYLTIKNQDGNMLSLENLKILGDVVGATVRVRDSQYTFAEGTVTAGTINSDTVAVSGLHDKLNTWGAYLEGKRWMLDEEGEWAYENGQLYLYAKNLPELVEASEHNTAISARDVTGLTIENVVIKNAFTNLDVTSSSNVVLQNTDFFNSSQYGIDAGCTNNLSLENSSIKETGRDGLFIGYCGQNVRVNNSEFLNNGTILMPRKSEAAVFGGFTDKLLVQNSRFTNSGYIAIRFFSNALIEKNIIKNACLVLDDCGAIYTFDRSKKGLYSQVIGNSISHVTGNPFGRTNQGWEADSAANGIYLDDNSSQVLVSGNTVSDTLDGLYLHGAFNNLIENNSFFVNHDAHVQLSDYGLAGTVRNNVFKSNTFGAGKAYRYGIETNDDTNLWATYSGNICQAGATDCQ